MTNNNTENKDKTIELRNATIYEFAESETPTAAVRLNIPFGFELLGIRSLSEYKRIALEDVRIKQGTLFELIEFIGNDMRETDYSRQASGRVAEFLLVLGAIGKGLSETLETIEMDFKRYKKAQTATAEKPVVIDADSEIGRAKDVAVDEPESESLAASLSNILNNPNLPVNIYNGLVNGLDEAFNALPNDANRELSDYQNSPEYLAKLIKLSEVKR